MRWGVGHWWTAINEGKPIRVERGQGQKLGWNKGIGREIESKIRNNHYLSPVAVLQITKTVIFSRLSTSFLPLSESGWTQKDPYFHNDARYLVIWTLYYSSHGFISLLQNLVPSLSVFPYVCILYKKRPHHKVQVIPSAWPQIYKHQKSFTHWSSRSFKDCTSMITFAANIPQHWIQMFSYCFC